MSEKQLSVYENNACLDAANAVAEQQIEGILTALYDAGVSDLSAMSREQLEGVIATMTADGTLSGIARATVLAFGDSLRKQAEAGKVPF